MKTEWDYTALADAYLKRPDYAQVAIDGMLAVAGVKAGDRVCDIGAGVAHLTLMLAAQKLDVAAVEPNDAMRNNGIKRTAHLPHVRWYDGTGENSGQDAKAFRLVTFGSSFNVCDRMQALKETARILQGGCWFACMWNHRSLEDPIQSHIEGIIRSKISGYDYGSRREDQAAIIDRSGLFGPVLHMDGRVVHRQGINDQIEAWRSHATLQRQAGGAFKDIVSEIERFLLSKAAGGDDFIEIPYTTNIWMARLR